MFNLFGKKFNWADTLSEYKNTGVQCVLDKIKTEGKNFETLDCHKKTALFTAIDLEDIELVTELVKQGANINYKVKNETSALVYAISAQKSADIMKLLISLGADVNATVIIGETILIYFIGLSIYEPELAISSEIVDILLKAGADVNAKSEDGFTALMNAVVTANQYSYDIVKSLISYGASVNEIEGESGKSILSLARDNENMDIIQLLIENGAQ